MMVRYKPMFTATQWHKPGDHPLVYTFATKFKVISEDPWVTEPLEYSHEILIKQSYVGVQPTDWIVERKDGRVDLIPNKHFHEDFEEVTC